MFITFSRDKNGIQSPSKMKVKVDSLVVCHKLRSTVGGGANEMHWHFISGNDCFIISQRQDATAAPSE